MAFLLTVGADVWLQGLIAMAFCSPTSRTLSSRDCWCPSFVEPLWSSLLDEAICISLQGSRSSPFHLMSGHVEAIRFAVEVVIIVLSVAFSFPYWTSLKNKFASTASVGSARAVFSELVNRLFQAVRVETVSPERFLSGCRGISFWGSYRKNTWHHIPL